LTIIRKLATVFLPQPFPIPKFGPIVRVLFLAEKETVMISLRNLCLVLIAFTAVPVAVAQCGPIYYVSTNGSDSNACGTYTAPWRTIQHAADKVTAGATVYVEAGTYSESVTFSNSGTSSAPIVFDGQDVAIVDGTSVSCCTTPSFASSNGFLCCNTQGLFTIGGYDGVNHLTIKGFTIQNYKTSSKTDVPAGILIAGSGAGINILNNTVRNIRTTAGATGNAYGIGVFGISATPLSVTVSGNTVTGCLTGQSETTTFNGNVQDFVFSNNTIHGNDNIGMDAIGFEGVGPTGYDQAKNGDVYGNVIYENSAINNPGEQGSVNGYGGYDQDGLYCDGCTGVTFERNTVYANDIGIEAASETPGEVSSYVIIRNNLVYGSNSCGMTVGGYAESGTGGSADITLVNNSLYDNDTRSTGSGEFQIQYRASGIVFENNTVYTGAEGLFIYGYVSGSGVTADYNDYYTTSSTKTFELNGRSYSTFASYQSKTGQDKNSVFANPDYDALPSCSPTGLTPPGGYTGGYDGDGGTSGKGPQTATSCTSPGNLDIASESPAINTGNADLGYPSGSGWSSYQLSEPFVGKQDFNGHNRINAKGEINIGAYEQ
jgi:hypothetical protein